MGYLQNLSAQHVQKAPTKPEAGGWVSYPLAALEESLVNAIYHRGYEAQPEPVKVYLYPGQMRITSYPGPVPGIELHHLQPGKRPPPVPARNRRIGELLKELRLAEQRGTGIPMVFDAMAQNGSPPPVYEFDEQRTYFTVALPAHPEYVAIAALRDVAQLEAVGDQKGALRRLEQAFDSESNSGSLAARLVESYARLDRLADAREVYDKFLRQKSRRFDSRAVVALANAYLEAGQIDHAKKVLDSMPAAIHADEAFEAAILEKRAQRDERAHELFSQAGEFVYQDARALHEFAQTKMRLTPPSRYKKQKAFYSQSARQLLLREAKQMLQRVIQMDAPPQRHAWAWYDLGRVQRWLDEPAETTRHSFARARELAPEDERLESAIAKASQRRNR